MTEGLGEHTGHKREGQGPRLPASETARGSGALRGEGGQVLTELAQMDDLLGQCEKSWKEIARHLDSLRRQIAVVGAQMQRSRSLAALKKPEDEPLPLEPGPRAEDHAEETRPQGLVQEYEASLREGHVRRDALRAEMAALRRRREVAFRGLPVPLARAYESLVDAGVLPAIATVADGVCSACGSAVPAPLNTDLAEGRAGVCSACDRLLRPESPPQTGQ